MGDEDDLDNEGVLDPEEEVEEDGSIPDPVAWGMFRKYMGWQDERDMWHIPDCVVHRDYHIFLYMLGRGLLSDYRL